MKSNSFFILFLCIAISSCIGQQSEKNENVNPKTFSEKIKETSNAQILDVRTPEEFASEHLDNAVNIDWYSANFFTEVEKLDKKQPVFIYCKSGGRSSEAAKKLSELGFNKIYSLEGGIMKWNAAGLSEASNKNTGMTTKEYDKLLSTDKKVLINFYAKWCAPCKKMAPYITEMQKDSANQVVIIRLDADEHKTLINQLKIDELPTLLLYKNKEVIWKHTGFISEEDLKKQLQ